jgi:MFS family permease
MADGVRTHPTLGTVRRLIGLTGFRTLFTTRLLSQLGDGIFQLAATDLLLFKHPGVNPAWTLTKLSAITLVPFSVIVPFVGVFIDRWDRRSILTVTPLIRTALIALIPVAAHGTADRPGFYLIVLLVLSGNRFFLATMSAVLPSLVAEDDLLIANSLATTGGSIANVVGLGIGAGLSAWIGGTNAGIVGGVGFLAAAILARTIPIRGGHPEVRIPLGRAIARVVREMGEGAKRLAASKRATYALASISAMRVLIGVSVATTAVVYIVRLKLGVGSVSALLSVLAVGVFSGVVLVPAAARRVREERIPSLGFLIGGGATIVTGLLVSRVGLVNGTSNAGATLAKTAIAGGSIFAGMAFAFAKIPVDTMVQESLPDEYRGRAFASYDMLYNVARVAGTALAAWLVAAHVGEPAIVLGVGAAYLLAAAVTVRASTRLDRPRAPSQEQSSRDE